MADRIGPGDGISDDPTELIVSAARRLDQWPFLEPPLGYPDSLALCIIDAIWSIGVQYGQVKNVIKNYRQWVRCSLRDDPETRGVVDLCHDIDLAAGPTKFAAKVADGGVVANRTLTSRRNGLLKADAVYQAAGALAGQQVFTTADLRNRHLDPVVEAAWCAIPGQGSGISWRYVQMNALIEDLKPDRMICWWVQRALNLKTPPSPGTARSLLHHAFDNVAAKARVDQAEAISAGPGGKVAMPLTLRGFDHAIWSWERKQRRFRPDVSETRRPSPT